ncbi:hypothetical protein I7I50_05976 [Histoplasma capsulatum G186AR]|uniref:Uncharacterized protein n=1 Tax=Ajellomyces capsulatus TaxID=5037 RepID=A0A8H8D209_AJECA|nr:hypothetical protein I7I52_08714 [Histoplasma capsulatum]QSS67030.1 hypothetical protein I7I50_05976 [Histoplasma capsulatum G186AR]
MNAWFSVNPVFIGLQALIFAPCEESPFSALPLPCLRLPLLPASNRPAAPLRAITLLRPATAPCE